MMIKSGEGGCIIMMMPITTPQIYQQAHLTTSDPPLNVHACLQVMIPNHSHGEHGE